DGVNYIIPANDDATKTIKLLLNIINETMLEGKKQFNKK
ncbi:MAG: 30S ribosomal protein S2, partial [Candidatus Falkowbacteria bacterium]|nr:30S ribosomal protein S2 [Candidatus Falkowbacteria bacterium]